MLVRLAANTPSASGLDGTDPLSELAFLADRGLAELQVHVQPDRPTPAHYFLLASTDDPRRYPSPDGLWDPWPYRSRERSSWLLRQLLGPWSRRHPHVMCIMWSIAMTTATNTANRITGMSAARIHQRPSRRPSCRCGVDSVPLCRVPSVRAICQPPFSPGKPILSTTRGLEPDRATKGERQPVGDSITATSAGRQLTPASTGKQHRGLQAAISFPGRFSWWFFSRSLGEIVPSDGP